MSGHGTLSGTSRTRFTIPMRGNERVWLPSSGWEIAEFTIPMRGNELNKGSVDGSWGLWRPQVYDPHEG